MGESSEETHQKRWTIPDTQTIQCNVLAAVGHESQALRRYSVSSSDIESEERWREALTKEALRLKRALGLLEFHDIAALRYGQPSELFVVHEFQSWLAIVMLCTAGGRLHMWKLP
jgi:hypothetical protein